MATRRLVQKEAGTIAYTLREIKDFSGNANADNPAVAVSVVGGRTVTSDELAREIPPPVPSRKPMWLACSRP